ncbi:MAG: HAMP domain-containing protein, partial [Solirubrobacterales bacterium]|nr:HAMP domain-containing protein [Solirubrobacterales bacterium]
MRLRHRVFAYVAAAALASCLFSVVVAVVLVRNRISAQRSSQLSQEAGAIVASGEALHGQHVFLEVGGRIRVLPGPQGRTILRQVPDHGSTTGEVSLPKRRLLYATADTAGGRVVVVRAAQLAFADWRPFLGILLLAGAGGAVLAAFFSLLLARRLSAPIHDLAEATTRLAAGEGDVQVTSRGNDELAELADAFNRMSADLAAARAAQQTFLESV